MIFPCWLMFLVLMPGRAVFRSSMVLRTWTQTSKVGLRSKEKQEAETGTQTLLELKVQSIWRKPGDGMGNPGGWPLAAGPRDRSPLAGPRYRRDAGHERAAGRDPGSHSAPHTRSSPRESPGWAAAQHRTAPLSPGRATRPASPDCSLTLRAVVHAVELPVRRQSVHGHRRGTSHRHVPEQPPPRRGPHPSRCHATWLPASAPPPRAGASGLSALRTAGAAGKASPSACARRGRHSDGSCWNPASFLWPHCRLRLFSSYIQFLLAVSGLFLIPTGVTLSVW